MYDCLQVSLPCAFPSQIVYRQYLPRSSFHRLARFPCRIFLSYGLHVFTSDVHRSLLRRLMAGPEPLQFSHIAIISRTFVFSLTQRLVFLSLYVVLSILHTLVCAAASLLCACLVSVRISTPYVIADRTLELNTCIFRHMTRLLLKITRRLSYAAQPVKILRCICLPWFFSLMLLCCPRYT